MNILCVIDNLSSGGSQRQMANLAVGFRELGNTVTLLTYHDIPFYDSFLKENGIDIHCIRELRYLKRILKIRRFIRQGKYDAVVSFLEGPNFICEVSGLPFHRWKLIVGERSCHPGISRSFRRILFRFFHLFSDYVVANSSTNLKIVRSVNPLLSEKKCRTIYNIVDLDLWKPSEYYIPLRNGRLKLIVVASHQFLKNLDGLIEALALLDTQARSRLEIEWYGDRLTEPYYSESLPRALKKLSMLGLEGTISFFPATRDILQKIQDADALGLFSLYEGLPNSVCEAMACAKPVICSAVSDMPQLLSYDPGLLFNPSDPASIAKSLSYLLSLGTRELSDRGSRNRMIAFENFEKRAQVQKYLNLIKQ